MVPALGTFVRISAHGAEAHLDGALRDATTALHDVERAMSFHRPDSALHELHRAEPGSTISVSAPLWEVLKLSKLLWSQSGGVFDPCVAHALVRDSLLPRPEGVPEPAADADFGDLDLPAAGQVRLRRRLWLDLGGIAKGYAVDRALDALRGRGMLAGSVNAGGDLACFGATQQVGLRDPRAPTRICRTLELDEAAMATSGNYFQPGALRGRAGAAVPVRGGSVTVVARDCATADGLTKVLWADPRRGRILLQAHGARALRLDARARARWL